MYSKSTSVQTLINRIKTKITAYEAGQEVDFTVTELKRISGDRRLKNFDVFKSSRSNDLYQELLAKAHRMRKESYILHIDNDELVENKRLKSMSQKYPKLTVEYLLKHGDNMTLPAKCLLPAIWSMTMERDKHQRKLEKRKHECENLGIPFAHKRPDMHQWKKISHLKFLYAEHPVSNSLVHLMRKAIHMRDGKLYNHIKKLGIDPIDEHNQYSEYFSDKIKRQIRYLRD